MRRLRGSLRGFKHLLQICCGFFFFTSQKKKKNHTTIRLFVFVPSLSRSASHSHSHRNTCFSSAYWRRTCSSRPAVHVTHVVRRCSHRRHSRHKTNKNPFFFFPAAFFKFCLLYAGTGGITGLGHKSWDGFVYIAGAIKDIIPHQFLIQETPAFYSPEPNTAAGH